MQQLLLLLQVQQLLLQHSTRRERVTCSCRTSVAGCAYWRELHPWKDKVAWPCCCCCMPQVKQLLLLASVYACRLAAAEHI
jgi:hypothetical protein